MSGDEVRADSAPSSIPPSILDPHRYQKTAPRLPAGALDFDTFVPGEGSIELEIGFGRGQFLLERARAAPASRIIGIEIKPKWSFLVEERRKAEGLIRVRAFQGDAREALRRAGPSGALARVFINFPDPWWKTRHFGRRVVAPAVLDDLARLLCTRGELFVQTDVPDRARDFIALIGSHSSFELAGEGGLIASNPYSASSNREKRAIADGLPIFRVLALRK